VGKGRWAELGAYLALAVEMERAAEAMMEKDEAENRWTM
jgi:hypothetical protein